MSARVLPWLLIGDKKAALDRSFLRQHNVRYILNMTPPRTEGGVANFFEKVRRCRRVRHHPIPAHAA